MIIQSQACYMLLHWASTCYLLDNCVILASNACLPRRKLLWTKGERKVSNDDDSSGDDHASNNDSNSDDDEFESPSYDDLVKLLNQYTKIIRKSRAKNEKLELKNDSLLAKCDIAEKASVELREANDAMSSKLKELKSSKKELKINMINLRGYTMSSSLAIIC